MQGRYRLRRRRMGDGLACGAHRSQAMRLVDTLPGGLGRSSPSEQIASKAPGDVGCCWWHSQRRGPSEFARVAQPNFGSSATRVPVRVLGA